MKNLETRSSIKDKKIACSSFKVIIALSLALALLHVSKLFMVSSIAAVFRKHRSFGFCSWSYHVFEWLKFVAQHLYPAYAR